jgi:Clp amino terminal domain, pathogenicity island component/ClpX C4-type zinc finger
VFERFTDRARRVVVLAQEESRLLNHNYIGTEHILLGLIHEGDGVAAQALTSLGISLADVRGEVERIIGHGGSAPSGHIPFTPRAKKVLELSLREALQLGHNYIGTEHILLGLIREGEGVAAQVLGDLGADLATVRQRVVQLLSGYQGGTSSGVFSSEGSGAISRAVFTRASTPQCSFCRRDLSEVERYAIGTGAAICNECITAAHAALAAATTGDEQIIVLPPLVTGAPPPDDPAAVDEILAAIHAALTQSQPEPLGPLRIIELRFISADLAEVRYSRVTGEIDTGDDPFVGTAVRDGGRWSVNLGFGFAPEA